MKPATQAVVLVVVVVALYFTALAYGFMRDDSNDASASDPSATKPGIRLLGEWTRPFAPRYAMGSLRCHGRLLSRGPQLSDEKTECVLPIDPRFDDRYRQVVLEIEPEPADAELATYVNAFYKEKDHPRLGRDPNECPLTTEMKSEEFRLEVELHSPAGENTDWDCWLRQRRAMPLRISVVRNRLVSPLLLPTLTLRCVGCGGEPARAITLRAEAERD